jgi:hypothetical protein
MRHNNMRRGLVALVAIGVALAAPSKSEADFMIQVSEDGKNFVTVASGSDFSPLSFSGDISVNGSNTKSGASGSGGDFTITILGSSSNNGASLSKLLSSTTEVSNNTSSLHTLVIEVTQSNYTLPASTKLTVESGLGGTVNKGALGLAGIFQAYADNTNLDFGTGFTNGPQTAVPSGSTFDTGSASGLFTRPTSSSPYSLTSMVYLTMGGNADINYANHVNVTPVPAPAGVVLAAASLPFLGIGAWLRRRKDKLQNG